MIFLKPQVTGSFSGCQEGANMTIFGKGVTEREEEELGSPGSLTFM